VQAAFGFNNAPRQEFKLPGLTLSSLPFEDEAGRFDLTLWLDQPADELRATWYYNTDLFDAATINRMQGHFETLLRSIVASPDARLSELEMLTAEEKLAREAEKQEREEANKKKLRSARRKFVSPQPAAINGAQATAHENASAGD
jgi:non-ribosomal peptide synthetase component F